MKPEFEPTFVSVAPDENERICLVSYEIARVRVGGGPEERTGFWKAYREALAVNVKTKYNNYRIQLCRSTLIPLQPLMRKPSYYRGGKLHHDAAPAKT